MYFLQLNSNLSLLKTEMNDMRHLGSLTITNSTANHTISNISGYKTLIFTGFDGAGTNHLDSIFIPTLTFKEGVSVTVNAYALTNYRATVTIKYISDTSVQLYAREMVGWSEVGIRVYGLI